jgi:adenylate kinase
VILLLMGAPGSGKGTQGRLLAQHFGIPYLASGDLLRRRIEAETEFGRQVQSYVERGLFVPDDVMVPAIMAELEALYRQHAKGVILDGFPRTREQAARLDAALQQAGTGISRALFLYVPKDILVARLASRWTCPNCGATYNLPNKPPRVPGICDVCGHTLYQRVDDQPDKVERRLSVDLEKAVPVAAHYNALGLLCQIDGNRPASEVTAALIAAVRECPQPPHPITTPAVSTVARPQA